MYAINVFALRSWWPISVCSWSGCVSIVDAHLSMGRPWFERGGCLCCKCCSSERHFVIWILCFCHIRILLYSHIVIFVHCYFNIDSMWLSCHICHCDAVCFVLINVYGLDHPVTLPPPEKYFEHNMTQNCYNYVPRDTMMCIYNFIYVVVMFLWWCSGY